MMRNRALVCSVATTIFLLAVYRITGARAQQLRFKAVPEDLDEITDNSSSVVNGSVVLLFCSAIGDTAPPTISWTRDGVNPENPPLVHITTTVTNLTKLTSSMLTIRGFSPATAGLYECRASLQGTTIQSSINLTAATNEINSSVSIFNFTQSDAGIYQCVFFTSTEVLTSAPLRLDTGPVSLTAVSPSLVYSSPPAPIVAEVYAQGEYSSILWSACNSPSTQYIINFGQTLVRTDPSPSDYGPYTASLDNSSNETVTVVVTQYELPNITSVEISPASYVLQGSNANITCVATGSPPPAITWTLNGQPTPYQSFTFSTLPSTIPCGTIEPGQRVSALLITSISSSGNYTCNATNINGSSWQSVYIEVQVPPNITSPAAGFTYTANSSDPVTFQCTASGIPPPLITFYDSYGPLSSDVDPRVILSDPITGSVTIGQQTVSTTSRNLTINSTRDGDSGNYTCVVSNQGVTTLYSNRTFQLVVQLFPTITTPPANQVVIQSNSISLTCGASGVPTPNITWWRTWSNGSSTQVSDGQNISVITLSIARNTTSTLTIQSAQPSHAGNYTCTATNVVGSVSATANVFVQVPPNITSPAAGFTYTVNSSYSVTFQCTASGIPPPLITFYNSYGPLSSDVDSRVILSDPIIGSVTIGQQTFSTTSRNLTINSTEDGDSGNYTCVAFNNRVATFYSNLTFQLVVQLLPTITTLPANQAVIQSNSISLTCGASGVPTPNITWWMTWSNGSSTQVSDGQNISIITSSIARNTTSTLTIQSAQPSHAGNYTCTATNVVGSVSATANVFVQVPPNITSPAAGFTYTVNSSYSVTFQCTASGIPPPLITFYDSYGPLSSDVDPRFILSDPIIGSVMIGQQTVSTTSRNLTINSTEDGDSGNYTCVAFNNRVATFYSNRTFQLVVQLLPTITTPPANQVVIQSNSISLTCGASGVPTPNITWWRTWSNGSSTQVSDGQNISIITSSLARNTTSTLTIQSAQPSHAGNYTCTATNVVGSVSATANVFVQVAPSVAPVSTPLVAVEGGNVTISFVVKDAIPPVQPRNLMWFYSSSFLPTPDGGVNITNTTGRTQISSFSFSAFANSTVSLTITNIVVRGPGGGLSDEGRYFLVASNPAGFSFGFVDVRVQGIPRVEISPVSSVVISTNSATFSCFSYANPPPVVWWVFTSNALGSSTNLSNGSYYNIATVPDSIVVNSTLSIYNVQYQDRGQYNCTASNVVGTVSSEATLTVHVKPVVTSISNNSEVNISQPFSLQCIATGFPPPTLSWSKNGANVPYGPSIFSVNLTTTQLPNSLPQVGSALNFTSLQRNDTANYTCAAMNAILTTLNDSQTSQLVILELPDPPINTTISQYGSRWLLLTWMAGFSGNKPITSFNINEPNLNTSLPFQLVNNQTQTDQYFYNISSGIAPFTNYSFTVQACNQLGCGQNGVVVFVFTLQDRPDTAPSNCSTNGNTSTSIGLQWLLPVIPNGVITSYNITYRALVSRSGIITNDDALALSCSNVTVLQNGRLGISELNTTLFPLLKATSYMFEITAFTSAGEGPACQVNASTSDDVPEASPVGLAASSPSSTSIQVSWGLVQPACRNGLILEYNVVYTTVFANGPLLSATKTAPPSGTTLLTDLKIFANYSVCVQARTSVGTFGPCSAPVMVRTLNDTAGAPQDVITSELGTSQATVQWSLPNNPNGIVTAYKIYYNSSAANLTSSTMATNLTLYNLSPGTEYTIGVSAINGAGEGTMSAPKIIKTFTINNGNASASRNAGIAVGVVILAVLIIMLVGLIYGYFWMRQRTYKRSLNDDPHVLANSYTLIPQESESLLTPNAAATPEPIKRSTPTPKLAAGNPIPVEMFGVYVQEKHVNENWAFCDEYKMINDGLESRPVNICLAPENASKNRYNNVLAYDHSRVILNPIPGYSNDYINANYIPGYTTKKEYIATQGPLPDTLGDFWRMVWDNSVTTIVMLTNLQENAKVKCTQYWPSSGSQVYANITVTHVDTSTFADFELRHFNIQANGSKDYRLVAQFHFVSWPDFGVPRTPVSLLHFLQRVRLHQPSGQPQPIVIHCSAGVGRTGTFLAIDVELQRAKAERVVNPFLYVKEMRKCRNLMVQTEDQYVFLHDAILEGLTYCDTVIPAEKLDEKVARLEKTRGGQTGYQTEFDAMKTPRVGPQLFTTATSPENQTKNLFSYALPYDYNLVHATHYINASCVDGFYKKAYYIAAQGPLQSSIGDFWQMIWDNEIQVIVMLSQLTEDDEILCPQYWPVNLQTPEKFDSITVELLSEKALESYTVRSIKLTQQTSEVSNSMVIQHYHYQSWQESKAPESATGVVELCEQVMKVQRHSGNKPIVIHCSDGVGRTGALCAVMIAIDRLKIEGVVDVQHTIRLLRTQRPNMVRTPDQYRFIYRAVKEYVNSLSDYSNFK
ncbi:hypothetical protein EMCRGX_G019787 [Ephydatia muelleri]